MGASHDAPTPSSVPIITSHHHRTLALITNKQFRSSKKWPRFTTQPPVQLKIVLPHEYGKIVVETT